MSERPSDCRLFAAAKNSDSFLRLFSTRNFAMSLFESLVFFGIVEDDDAPLLCRFLELAENVPNVFFALGECAFLKSGWSGQCKTVSVLVLAHVSVTS